MKRKWVAVFLTMVMGLSMTAYANVQAEGIESDTESAAESTAVKTAEQAAVEETLNLANNENQEWSYSSEADAWTLTSVTAVAYPEIEEEQGVSVCVPGAYVTGIDTDGDGAADVTGASYSQPVKGSLVIDYEAKVTSTNGQVYSAATAPVIVNTGAAGYSEQQNQNAASTYAAEGYINVACGNRGKQSAITDEDGNTVYTGDAPSCLVDQKNAVRFVKYNILLGNLPGSVDYFVSTGGSGGGAHATMLAATGDQPDYYDYEIEAGAVGIYQNEDGSYLTTVTIEGEEVELSDAMWGCMAYSAITSLAEADMAMALEYYMDTTYDFNTDFQKQLAEYLSQEYMEYINEKALSVEEAAVGFDLNEDGDLEDTVDLTIEYDPEKYPETNGYYGTYLNLYLNEFQDSLKSYLERLDYAEDWTWFDADGNALSDEEVASMTTEEKAAAFLEGRYAKGSSGGGMGGPGGGFPGGGRGNFGGNFGGNGGPDVEGFAGGGKGDFGGNFGGNGGPGGEGFAGGGKGDFGGNFGGNGGPDGEGFAGGEKGDFGGDISGNGGPGGEGFAGGEKGNLSGDIGGNEGSDGEGFAGGEKGNLSGDIGVNGDSGGEGFAGGEKGDFGGDIGRNGGSGGEGFAGGEKGNLSGDIGVNEGSDGEGFDSEENSNSDGENTSFDGDGFPGDIENSDSGESLAEGINDMNGELPEMNGGDVMTEEVGTPDAGTTQSAGSATDSKNYSSFEEMLESYQADVAEIEAGDKYGNNIVELYNPINYIGAEDTTNPTWARILLGASEGDISMFNSLNLEIAWLNAGTEAEIEWQWDGGHVPSEILGDSLALYVDIMYGKYADGAVSIEKAAAEPQTTNGTADEASGKDMSGWVSYDNGSGVSFSLADIAAYRTAGASKAIPGFDVMDYGQEDYVFGDSDSDARHWNKYLLTVFEEHADTFSALFNSTNRES